jgi:DNA-binding response OmpR family regulator
MTVLIVGLGLEAKSHGVREAIERTGTSALYVATIQDAKIAMRNRRLRCALVGPGTDVREVNAALRESAECFSLPLIALTDCPCERVIVELHLLGADDVVSIHDVGGLTRRLAALESYDPGARTPMREGSCLLAHPDPYRRQQLGRVLRQFGFDVYFAADTSEALQLAARTKPAVMVVSDLIPPEGGRAALERLSSHLHGEVPTVLLSSNPDHARSSLTVVREDAPADDLMFVLNELLTPKKFAEARGSQRILHFAVCAYRTSGELRAQIGLTYNISREGLYVRTFDAPQLNAPVWLELCAPGTRTLCHLRGRVAWTRTLTTGAHGAVPPGFGIKLELDQCPTEDAELYTCGYEITRVRNA